jgi:hypothetical protein
MHNVYMLFLAGMGGMDNPLAIAQMLSNMDPQMQAQMAQQMGVSPDQLRQLAQVCATATVPLITYALAQSVSSHNSCRLHAHACYS